MSFGKAARLTTTKKEVLAGRLKQEGLIIANCFA
jgi:hypothetical protein